MSLWRWLRRPAHRGLRGLTGGVRLFLLVIAFFGSVLLLASQLHSSPSLARSLDGVPQQQRNLEDALKEALPAPAPNREAHPPAPRAVPLEDHGVRQEVRDMPAAINIVPIEAKPQQHVDGPNGVGAVPPQNQNRLPLRAITRPQWKTEGRTIDGHAYPQLTADGSFIPMRRIVHLDLKGAPYKPEFFSELFFFLNRAGATGILIEWEDMFPFKGKLAEAANGNAYTMEQVEAILRDAKRHHLSVIPLVQTFGHLEWVLKLEPFVHLREDPQFPQVICFGLEESWKLLQDMIDQVATVHKKHGMEFFHMGADEAFQVGVCNATIAQVVSKGSRDRAMLWHIGRTAEYIKEKHNTTVLAWHDMFAHVMEADMVEFKLPQVLEPMLWSYAEDLDQYLSSSTWFSLQAFPRVWGASAFKGADGPARFYSNPVHYVRNHESWISQLTRNHNNFEYIQGLVLTGWSRYDHLAVLCELLPVALPQLAMSLETIKAGKPLNGFFTETTTLLACSAPMDAASYVYGCAFPGRKIYEFANELKTQQQQLRRYLEADFEFNGWLSRIADRYDFSSAMYIQKILPFIEYHIQPLERIEKELRQEMNKIFFADTVDEWIDTYMGTDLALLRGKLKAAKKILEKKIFQKRPFIKRDDL